MKSKILASMAVLAAIAIAQPYRIFRVDGTSMTPTYQNQQILLGVTHPGQVQRGDVIVFKHDDETLIKRVGFLPGDSIEQYKVFGSWIIPGTVKLRAGLRRKNVPRKQFVVPDHSVYVLADNPDGTLDSRIFGAIPDENIIAVVPEKEARVSKLPLGARLGGVITANL